MDRRGTLLALLALGGIPLVGVTQPKGKVSRIGWLEWTEQGRFSEATGKAFVEGLKADGYVVGSNLAIEKRVANGDRKMMATQAKELAGLGVDVFFTPSKAAT